VNRPAEFFSKVTRVGWVTPVGITSPEPSRWFPFKRKRKKKEGKKKKKEKNS